MKLPLLSTSCLPPIWYVEQITRNKGCIVEIHEHFIKQTIRNRYHILSPNGVQSLVIPISHTNRSYTPMKEILISNREPWQRMHWRSLNAAYRRSPYFEFYMDDLEPFYLNTYHHLVDFNLALLDLVCRWLQIKPDIRLTEKYEEPDGGEFDYRIRCNSGDLFIKGDEKRYPQVFSSKFEFIPGLSIIDLIFNTGPEATRYLAEG